MSKLFLTLLLSWFLAAPTAVAAADDLRGYPPAGQGMVRYVLRLPPQDPAPLPSDIAPTAQVQLLVGRTVVVDAYNRHAFLGGRIHKRETGSLTWYRVQRLGGMASTRRAPGPMEERFVQSLGGGLLIRYNSQAPIVVYAPAGVEVRYRIWRAEPEINGMTPG